MSAAECEETIRRIRSHRGVKGVLIVDTSGVPIYSSLSAEETTDVAAHISQLASKARGVVRCLDPEVRTTDPCPVLPCAALLCPSSAPL